jgi:hypothetical protein
MLAALLCGASAARAQTRGDVAASADAVSAAAVISQFDARIVKTFAETWQRAGGGTRKVEAAVLIVRSADGSCKAVATEATNEYRRLTFRWQPGTIAIVHTHPNGDDPKPSLTDVALAERFRVPIFTLTLKGMFLYDPATRAVSRVQQGIDWMDYSRWSRDAPVMARRLAASDQTDSTRAIKK